MSRGGKFGFGAGCPILARSWRKGGIPRTQTSRIVERNNCRLTYRRFAPGADEGVRPYTRLGLFCGNQIELAGRLFVKNGALLLISTAPVFVSSGHSQEVAWADTLLARFVFV